MCLMTVLLAMMLGTEVNAGSSASVVLLSGASEDEPGALVPGLFSLDFEDAFVAQGSYSGLWLTFKTQTKGSVHHKLTVFIPSHEEFSVGYASRRGEFEAEIPQTPFTFEAEVTTEISDRFGRPRPMKVALSHWLKVGKQHWSETSVDFTECKIEVESMFIEEHLLTFSGSFECRSEEPAYSASGQFSVNGGKLGVSKVD